MSSTHPSLDTVFELLANRRRRFVLYYLAMVEDEAAILKVEDIVTQLREWERKWTEAESSEARESQESVRIDLHHNHLPRLAATGLIDYDARTETIRNWESPSIIHWVDANHPELSHLHGLFDIDEA